ncbi:MAG: SpoIID/LytB domain-containing protein [Gemmatimonas sp.]|nr:SpoIID/LytB domain-containing protein [Gemmatimonas sp.]
MVRVGLIVDTTAVQLGATTDYELVDPAGQVVRRLGAEETVTVHAGPASGLIVEVGGVRDEVGNSLIVRPSAEGFVFVGEKFYRGTALVRSVGPGRLTAINQVDMESYLLGVVPHEIGRVGPELLEAAKAQAVAARTYALRYLGRRDSLGFDVFATVEDQVYGGAEAEHDPVTRSVLETSGEILTYGGEPVDAFYHSTCAGRTAAIHEVWPDEVPRPYLVSVVDVDPETGEAFDVTSNRFRWTERWTADELQAILSQTLADSLPAGQADVGELLDFEVFDRTTSGRIRTLRITTSEGFFDVGGDRIRWIFPTPSGSILNSSKFDVHTERDSQGRVQAVVAEGMGWGHGIGMCQVGAMGRARAGQSYRTILGAYYPGTDVVDLY